MTVNQHNHTTIGDMDSVCFYCVPYWRLVGCEINVYFSTKIGCITDKGLGGDLVPLG